MKEHIKEYIIVVLVLVGFVAGIIECALFIRQEDVDRNNKAISEMVSEGKYSYRIYPEIGDHVILVATKDPFIIVSTYSVRDAGPLVVLKNGDKTLTVSMRDIRKVKVVE